MIAVVFENELQTGRGQTVGNKKILTTTNVLDGTLILKNKKVDQNVGEDQKEQESVFNEKIYQT